MKKKKRDRPYKSPPAFREKEWTGVSVLRAFEPMHTVRSEQGTVFVEIWDHTIDDSDWGWIDPRSESEKQSQEEAAELYKQQLMTLVAPLFSSMDGTRVEICSRRYWVGVTVAP